MVLEIVAWARRWWRRLVHGCWLQHADRIRERRDGVYRHVCPRCGDAPALLPGQHGRVVSVERTPLGVLAARRRLERVEEFHRRRA